MTLTDHENRLICTNCSHPVHSETAFVNKGSDEKGTYVICTVCGNKIYLSRKVKE